MMHAEKALSQAAGTLQALNNTCYSHSIVVIIAAVMTDSGRGCWPLQKAHCQEMNFFPGSFVLETESFLNDILDDLL